MPLSHSKKKADQKPSKIIDSFYSPTRNNYFSLIAVFLTWFIGREKAGEILLSKRIVTEEMVFQMPAQVSSAVQNPELKLEKFRKLFDEDAWASVLQMGNNLNWKRIIPFIKNTFYFQLKRRNRSTLSTVIARRKAKRMIVEYSATLVYSFVTENVKNCRREKS